MGYTIQCFGDIHSKNKDAMSEVSIFLKIEEKHDQFITPGGGYHVKRVN